MTPLRTLRYIWKRERRYQKLVWPMAFFLLEISLIAMIAVNVLGLELAPANGLYFQDPLVLVKLIHPADMLMYYFPDEEIPFFALNRHASPLHMLLHGASMLVALVGACIALLWMNRFFKINHLNIEWWMWPTGCIGAHTLCLWVML